MDLPEPMSMELFRRLGAVEQAQELLRLAQLGEASSRIRHANALDRHQRDLERHAAYLAGHKAHMAHLETMLERQQELQKQMTALMDRTTTRTDDHGARLAQNEVILGKVQLTLDAVLRMLQGRNGH